MALDREETELKAELERIGQNIDVILKRVALQLTEVAQQRKSNSSLEGAETPGLRFDPASIDGHLDKRV